MLHALLLSVFFAGCARGDIGRRKDATRVDGAIRQDSSTLADIAVDDGPIDAMLINAARESSVEDAARDGRTIDAAADLSIAPDRGPADLSAPDLWLADLGPTAPNVGEPCTSDTTCRGGTACRLELAGGVRICTMACVADDPSTTAANEDTCPLPQRNICTHIPLTNGTTGRYCLQRCKPSETANACPAQLKCAIDSPLFTRRLGQAVCMFSACKTNSDCPVIQSTTCSATTGIGCNAAGGEFCLSLETNRAQCAKPGKCDLNTGRCKPHAQGMLGAKIGDACAADTDCPDGAVCLQPLDTGRFANGYCTIVGCVFNLSATQCPTGSACNRAFYSGLCQKTCSLATASDCRGHGKDSLGDYECYDWSRILASDGKPTTTAPVCDTPLPCSALTCSVLGDATNTTNMSCRDPLTNKVVASTTSGAM
ncbi:MAG: hypothetical protein KDK91_18575, partial [Gammaproteobacteria bacterium]|nr:hypothetical protein [Gammaproteobacteria bacterium]